MLRNEREQGHGDGVSVSACPCPVCQHTQRLCKDLGPPPEQNLSVYDHWPLPCTVPFSLVYDFHAQCEMELSGHHTGGLEQRIGFRVLDSGSTGCGRQDMWLPSLSPVGFFGLGPSRKWSSPAASPMPSL